VTERPAFDVELEIANAFVEDFGGQLVLRGFRVSGRVFALDGRPKLCAAIGWRLIQFRRSRDWHHSPRRSARYATERRV
jgi:hypothetical protein